MSVCLIFEILLCLNCAFNILNQVSDFCQSSCEHYDDHGRQSDIMFAVCDEAEPLEVSCETR